MRETNVRSLLLGEEVENWADAACTWSASEKRFVIFCRWCEVGESMGCGFAMAMSVDMYRGRSQDNCNK